MNLDFTKVEALAKRGHVMCHGRGFLRKIPFPGASSIPVLCPCVIRNLERKGVNVRSVKAVREEVGP